MKKFLLPLLASFALPTAVNAESIWLIIYGVVGYTHGGGGLEKVEMKDMTQCELMGAKLISSQKMKINHAAIGYECIKGK